MNNKGDRYTIIAGGTSRNICKAICQPLLETDGLGQVQEALSFAIEYYKGKSLVPKKLAMAMVDIFGAFCFNSGFSEKELRELEDIGMKLQEQALELFDE